MHLTYIVRVTSQGALRFDKARPTIRGRNRAIYPPRNFQKHV